MIGNDFVKHLQKAGGKCSECGIRMPKGSTVLASIKDGKVIKKVCSEECRLTFDDWFWRGIAAKRKRR